MGPDGDDAAVLDSRFRVRNIKNLRVVDASIFPKIPGYFIVANIYMASEKAADSILQDADRESHHTTHYPRDLQRLEAEAIRQRRRGKFFVEVPPVLASQASADQKTTAVEDGERSEFEDPVAQGGGGTMMSQDWHFRVEGFGVQLFSGRLAGHCSQPTTTANRFHVDRFRRWIHRFFSGTVL